MRRIRSSGSLLPTAIASLALFVALGGPAAAVDLVTSNEIKRNAVRAKHVKDGSLSEQELAGESIDSARVRDGALSGADVGRFSGSTTINFGTINAGQCGTAASPALSAVTASQDLQNDVILVTPGATFPQGVSIVAKPASANQISVTLCNHTAVNLNVGTPTFRYVSINT